MTTSGQGGPPGGTIRRSARASPVHSVSRRTARDEPGAALGAGRWETRTIAAPHDAWARLACTGCSCPERRPYLVSVIRVKPTPRGAGHLLRAVVAAWLLVLALVVPVGAVEGPTSLNDAAASATKAAPGTTITFTVTYRNHEGSAPAYVRVVIDGHPHDMTSNGGDDWKQGVGHHYATTLATGTHNVAFVAADTRKFNNEVSGGTITITITPPAPTPTPHPTPTPTPTPKPTPTPAPTPTPTPPPAPGGDTGGPGGGSGGSGGTGGSGWSNPGAS